MDQWGVCKSADQAGAKIDLLNRHPSTLHMVAKRIPQRSTGKPRAQNPRATPPLLVRSEEKQPTLKINKSTAEKLLVMPAWEACDLRPSSSTRECTTGEGKTTATKVTEEIHDKDKPAQHVKKAAFGSKRETGMSNRNNERRATNKRRASGSPRLQSPLPRPGHSAPFSSRGHTPPSNLHLPEGDVFASMSMQGFALSERKAPRQKIPFLLRAPKALQQQFRN